MKVKEWVNEHKEQIVMTGLAVGAFALGYYICRSNMRVPKVFDKGVDCGTIPPKPYQKIDEDIFTNIAPWIEDAVLAEGVDEDLYDITYKVPFPKGGDWKNGTYDVLKKVKILVQDVGDAVNEVEI